MAWNSEGGRRGSLLGWAALQLELSGGSNLTGDWVFSTERGE
jgi:hypothetical protein